jgi:DNA-binding transcriptional MerR regulator
LSPDGMWSIGELAERAGVTVKTVRFYSDRGLLPEAARSGGGHRRYGPEALDRLRLIRSLRALDLPVPAVGRVVDREDAIEDALEDAIAGRLQQVGSQLTALRWREAALHAVRDGTAGERAERLRLVGAMTTPPSTDALARFWRRVLPVRLPARLLSTILEQTVPQPPADPTPAQVLTYARLHALVTEARRVPHVTRPEFGAPGGECRPAVLYEGLGEAFTLAAGDVRAQAPPRQGEALDCFVAAYAAFRGARDTPAFRRGLSGLLAQIADPLLDGYWRLVAELPGAPAEPTLGATDDWLRAALETQTARA